jgi:O-acetyl-ADP-ribose deacetylase (regulator of RNase III)
MRTIRGDLIALAKAGQFDVIAHGCNCFHTMGAGVAAQIRQHFPAAFEADLATPYGDRGKLGTCSVAVVETGTGRLHVVNAYTQFDYVAGRVEVDYDAVYACMTRLRATYARCRIGLPRIGAGLGGGDWSRIETIIADSLAGEDVTIVEFGGGP